jgi:N-acyl-D-amino-acid deacylase
VAILRGAKVIDGRGGPALAADVVIDGCRITAVAAPGAARGGEVVDLDGLVLSPGFIDCHTHYDAQVLWDPDLTPSSWHGVTSVVMGNCGFGIAPTRPEHRDTIARTLENVEGMSLDALAAGIPWTFETFPEYLDAVAARRPRLNTAVMVGHTPLRLYVLGDEAGERAATEHEIARMRQLVGEAIDAGAVGFATSKAGAHLGAGGKPVPSRLAEPAEIFSIGGALADRGRGVFAVTYGEDFFVDELSALSRQTGRPVTWTALSSSRRDPGAREVLDRQDALGGELWPQIACRPIVMQVTLEDPAPLARAAAFADVLGLPHTERAGRYRDPAWRARARADTASIPTIRWGSMTVQETTVHHELKDGPTLSELAAARGVHPIDVLCDLSLAEDLRTRFKVVVGNDDDAELAHLLGDERVLLGLSDAGAHASQICDAVFSSYLLEHWVRETGVLSLEQAVWRVTGHPAAVFRLPGRGVIAPGSFADLVAFDPDTIGVEPMERVFDLPAGADRLVARSRGIEAVWVNGTPIRRDGKDLADSRPGRLIRDGGR